MNTLRARNHHMTWPWRNDKMAENNEQEWSGEKDPFLNDTGPPQFKPEIILHEAHFIPLRNQSNIYGLLDLCIDGSNKLVVTTLRGEVHCLEFHDPLVQRPPSFKPITFSYIPGGGAYDDCILT